MINVKFWRDARKRRFHMRCIARRVPASHSYFQGVLSLAAHRKRHGKGRRMSGGMSGIHVVIIWFTVRCIVCDIRIINKNHMSEAQ